jgi:hypothetical protein
MVLTCLLLSRPFMACGRRPRLWQGNSALRPTAHLKRQPTLADQLSPSFVEEKKLLRGNSDPSKLLFLRSVEP